MSSSDMAWSSLVRDFGDRHSKESVRLCIQVLPLAANPLRGTATATLRLHLDAQNGYGRHNRHCSLARYNPPLYNDGRITKYFPWGPFDASVTPLESTWGRPAGS